MNKKELNSFSMMKNVDQFFTINFALFADKPAIIKAHARLKVKIDEIETNGQTQAINTEANTAIKGEVRNTLTNTTLKVAAAIKAVAVITTDAHLKMIANISRSELNRMHENDYVIKIRAISEAAQPIASDLSIWGVTQDEINSMNADATNFLQCSPINRNIVTHPIQATADIKTRMAEANVLLSDTLDTLMLPYKNINHNLHGLYLIARSTFERNVFQDDNDIKEM